MIPRTQKQVDKLPSLVSHLIEEIDEIIPGKGQEIYWRAFDKWNKNGRENHTKYKNVPEIAEINKPTNILDIIDGLIK